MTYCPSSLHTSVKSLDSLRQKIQFPTLIFIFLEFEGHTVKRCYVSHFYDTLKNYKLLRYPPKFSKFRTIFNHQIFLVRPLIWCNHWWSNPKWSARPITGLFLVFFWYSDANFPSIFQKAHFSWKIVISDIYSMRTQKWPVLLWSDQPFLGPHTVWLWNEYSDKFLIKYPEFFWYIADKFGRIYDWKETVESKYLFTIP